MLYIEAEMIKEISDQLDMGMKCFYHLKTGELVVYPDSLKMGGELDEEAWKEEITKVEEDATEYLLFTAMDSYESFDVIEEFVLQIDKQNVKEIFEETINQKKPFQSFKNLLFDYPELRQQWFLYKAERYRIYVEEQLDVYIEKSKHEDVLNLGK